MGAMGAKAAAQGETVAFASDNPDKEEVAHETAHVVQRRQAGGGGLSAKSGISSPGDAAEQEADAVASEAAKGEQVEVGAKPSAGIHLEESDDPSDDPVYEATGADFAAKTGSVDPAWTYIRAKDPIEALQLIDYGAYDVYDKKGYWVQSLVTLVQQYDDLKSKVDPDHELIAKDAIDTIRADAKLYETTWASLEAKIPSTDKLKRLKKERDEAYYEYRIVGRRRVKTAESQAEWDRRTTLIDDERYYLERQVDALEESWTAVYEKAVMTDNELQPLIKKLVTKEIEDTTVEYNQLTFDYYPHMKGKAQRDSLKDIERVGGNLDQLSKVKDSHTIRGDELAAARQQVQADKKEQAGPLLIAKTRSKARDYVKNGGPMYLQRANDKVSKDWMHADSTDAWMAEEGKLTSAMYDLQYLDGDYVSSRDPERSDAQAFATALDAGIRRWENSVDAAAVKYAPVGAAMVEVELLIPELERLRTTEEPEIMNSLPDLKEALIHKHVTRRIDAMLKTAKTTKTALEETGQVHQTAAELKTKRQDLETLVQTVRDEVGPKWFEKSGELEDLKEMMKKGGFSDEDMKWAAMQLKLAGAMSYHKDWMIYIDAAKTGIAGNPADLAKQAKSMKYIEEFEDQVNKDFSKQVAAIIGNEKIKSLRDHVDGVKGDLELFVGAPGLGDMDSATKLAAKTANQQIWKRIISSGGRWADKLGKFKGGLDKATTALGLFSDLHKVAHGGDRMSVSKGATHPAMEALSGAMSAVNTFNKVPVFNVLVSGYIKVVDGLSKSIGALAQRAMKQKLGGAAFGIYLDKPVDDV
jgi:hypothetical protein